MDFMHGSMMLAQATSTEVPPAAEGGSSAAASMLDRAIDWVAERLSAQWVMDQVEKYGPNLLEAIAIFVIGRWGAKFVTSIIVRAARKARVDATLVGFLDNLIYMLLLMAVSISALTKLGIEATSLTAVLAAAGFAVGMAMQGSLGNLAAGVMLVFFKPFRVGDLVRIGDNQGTVVEIQIFNTIMLTLDNIRIIVPNSKITDATIENLSAERERRIDLVIGCGYSDDIRAVKATLQEILESHPRVLDAPSPIVAVSDLGSSSVDFVVRPWVMSGDYWSVRFELIEQIKLAFDDNGYTIPFPSRDLFLHNPVSGEQASFVQFPKAA